MPTLQIFTNVSDKDIPADFLKTVSAEFQKAIGKPEKYIHVHLIPNQQMMFGGSMQECASVNLVSIGKLGLEENKVLTQSVTALLAKINIPADRIYVIFKDVPRQDIGWNNTTFAF